MFNKKNCFVVFIILNICGSIYCLDFGDDFYDSLENIKNKGISDVCADDITRLNINLKNITLWAMEMWESTAKEVSGSLHGTNYQLGNFDECLTPIRYSNPNDPSGIPRQYCLPKIVFENSSPKNYKANVTIFELEGSAIDRILANGDPSRIERDVLYSAICVPATCTTNDLNKLLNTSHITFKIYQKYNLSYTVTFDDESCQKDMSYAPYTTGSMIMICILSVLSCLVIISTALHWYTEYNTITSTDLIKCFSIMHHVKQLTKKNEKDKELEIMYGIRVIAIFFIILDHRFGTTMQGPLINRETAEGIYRGWESNFIYQTEIFVDTFFILSGLLTVYQLLKYFEKKSVNFIQVIFLRYIRLMALYVFVIFLTVTILPQSGSGPLWNVVMDSEAEHCRNNWWTNVLMISNYVNVNKMCMVHSWYIPCDFHFFILALIVCTIMKNQSRTKIGLILMSLLLCISIAIPALVTYYMKLPAILEFYNDFLRRPRDEPIFQNIYITSHTRLTAYVMGLLTGYFVYKFYKPGVKRVSIVKSSFIVLLIAILYLVLIFITSYFVKSGKDYDRLKSALYAGLQRPIRALGTCLFILVCIFGEIPFIQKMLSWTPWMILGKLTYAAYLIHMGLQLRMAASIRTPVFLNIYSILQLSIADAFISFIISFIGYLLIEGPVNFVIKMIFSPPRQLNLKPEEIFAEKGRTNEGLELEQDVNKKNDCKIHTVS